MKMTHDIKALVTQIVARDIAAGVELARSMGHRMPAEFDVGVRFLEDGGKTRVRMRMNDATHDAIVSLPDLISAHSLQIVDTMWKTAWERIHADALTVSQVWLDRHPEALGPSTTASSFLDALQADPVLSKRWLDTCLERARGFKYETVL